MDRFTYLGNIISEDDGCREDVKSLIAKAQGVCLELKTNINYSLYEEDCPLVNTLLIKQKFFSALKNVIFPIADFLLKKLKKVKLHRKELGAKKDLI